MWHHRDSSFFPDVYFYLFFLLKMNQCMFPTNFHIFFLHFHRLLTNRCVWFLTSLFMSWRWHQTISFMNISWPRTFTHLIIWWPNYFTWNGVVDFWFPPHDGRGTFGDSTPNSISNRGGDSFIKIKVSTQNEVFTATSSHQRPGANLALDMRKKLIYVEPAPYAAPK